MSAKVVSELLLGYVQFRFFQKFGGDRFFFYREQTRPQEKPVCFPSGFSDNHKPAGAGGEACVHCGCVGRRFGWTVTRQKSFDFFSITNIFIVRCNTFEPTWVIDLNTKNEIKRPLRSGHLVSFLVFRGPGYGYFYALFQI